jgi:hypothetical protein
MARPSRSENESLTDVGWQAWDVLTRCSSQIHSVPDAVIDIDFGAGS